MDLILHRYGTAVLDLDIDMVMELIPEAYKQQLDERLFEMWNFERLFMNKNNFVGFDNYKKQMLQPVKKKEVSKPKNKEEIFTQADKIIAVWKKTH